MASELNALGRAAARLAGRSPMTADLTRSILQRAIKQVVANFPVYRTYVDLTGSPSDADRRDIAWAIARARRFDPDVHHSAFDFLEAVLSAGTAGVLRAMRSAKPLQAAICDEASAVLGARDGEGRRGYRVLSLQSLPCAQRSRRRAGPLRRRRRPSFTKPTPQRAERWPHAMLATATHDTKRGEDARAQARRALGMSRRMATSGHIVEPAPARATWATSSAARRPTATTNTCSTRCSSAPGRWTCWTP